MNRKLATVFSIITLCLGILAWVSIAVSISGCSKKEEQPVAGKVTVTEAPTEHPAVALSPTDEVTPTESPTVPPTEMPAESPSVSPTEQPTTGLTPTEGPTVTPITPSPTGTVSVTNTPKPTSTPTKAPTSTPKPTSTPTKAPTSTPKPTSTPTKAPTSTPKPTSTPTNTPTQAPTATPKPTVPQNAKEVDLLTALIYTECSSSYLTADGMEEMIAIGQVVLNRMEKGSWGSTMYAVIHAKGQFSPVSSGGYYKAYNMWMTKEYSKTWMKTKMERANAAAVEVLANPRTDFKYLYFRATSAYYEDLYVDYVVMCGTIFHTGVKK